MYVNCLILKTMTMSDFYQLVRNRVEKFNNISEGFRTKKIKNKIEIIIDNSMNFDKPNYQILDDESL
jgi:hypothetical protein